MALLSAMIGGRLSAVCPLLSWRSLCPHGPGKLLVDGFRGGGGGEGQEAPRCVVIFCEIGDLARPDGAGHQRRPRCLHLPLQMKAGDRNRSSHAVDGSEIRSHEVKPRLKPQRWLVCTGESRVSGATLVGGGVMSINSSLFCFVSKIMGVSLGSVGMYHFWRGTAPYS